MIQNSDERLWGGVFGVWLGAVLLVAGASGAWSTYHGAPSLSGTSPGTVPDRLREQWRLKVGNDVPWPPVVGVDTVFCANDAGAVVAVGLDGERRWKTTVVPVGTNVPDRIAAPILHAGGVVVAAGESGSVYALDAGDGSVRWQVATGMTIQGAPNVTRRGPGNRSLVLVMAQPTGEVMAFDVASGARVWTSEETTRCDGHLAVEEGTIAFGSCAAGFHVLSASSGEERTFLKVGEGCEMAGGTVLAGGDVFSGNRSGSVAAARIDDEALLWVNEDGEGEMFTTPAVSTDKVVFCSGRCEIVCLDRADGTQVWRYATDAFDPVSPVIAGDKVVAVAGGHLVILALADGKRLAAYNVANQLRAPTVVDGAVIVVSDDGYVMRFGAPASPAEKETENE